MPVLSFGETYDLSTLKHESELGPTWHLLSKDILSPFGIKHRAVIKHKLEESKRIRKFVASAIIERKIKQSNFNFNFRR